MSRARVSHLGVTSITGNDRVRAKTGRGPSTGGWRRKNIFNPTTGSESVRGELVLGDGRTNLVDCEKDTFDGVLGGSSIRTASLCDEREGRSRSNCNRHRKKWKPGGIKEPPRESSA